LQAKLDYEVDGWRGTQEYPEKGRNRLFKYPIGRCWSSEIRMNLKQTARSQSSERPVGFESNGKVLAAYTLCGPRFLCCWHLLMMAERRRVRRSSGNS
jgi:hypothetical protein